MTTIIITFKNEKEQVLKTIQNFRKYTDNPMICINDASTDNYDYSELAGLHNVDYLVNEINLGVAESRDLAVSMAKTENVFICDGHMRIFEDVFTPLEKYLDSHPDTLACLQSRIMKPSEDGKDILIQDNNIVSRCCRIEFTPCKDFLGIKWEVLESEDFLKTEISIPCVLGACYGINRAYYLKLHGLNGLAYYGLDEQFLSTKVWLSGGRCVLLRTLEMAHLYRDNTTPPYQIDRRSILYNKLLYSELFSLEGAIPGARDFILNYVSVAERRLILQETDVIAEYVKLEKEYLQSIFVHDFETILKLNDYGHRQYPR